MLGGSGNRLRQVGIERLGGAQQQDAEAISGPAFADALADQPRSKVAHGFGGLEHLFGGLRINRRACVQYPVDRGHTQARLGGDGGDGWAFIVVHDSPLERLDRKLSSPAGPG